MWLKIFVCYIAVCSLITFALYAVDKKKAQKDAWRIPEKVLLGFSFLGGGIGGYAAMRICRHKTKHWYFHVVNVAGIVWQVMLMVFLSF